MLSDFLLFYAPPAPQTGTLSLLSPFFIHKFIGLQVVNF